MQSGPSGRGISEFRNTRLVETPQGVVWKMATSCLMRQATHFEGETTMILWEDDNNVANASPAPADSLLHILALFPVLTIHDAMSEETTRG